MTARESGNRPHIGVSANTMAPSRDRRLYVGKALQYAEAEMLEWIWERGGIPTMVPVVGTGTSEPQVADLLDGLVLTGGTDISPSWYGEEPRRPEWAGDLARDRHEINLVREFARRDKPVLGICRGHQLINVAYGGSLYQDVIEDGLVERLHRDPEPYDLLDHIVRVERGSYLSALYPDGEITVNSVHHQAIRKLAAEFEVMAYSDDGVIEAIHHRAADWIVGVQWHPEWVNGQRIADGLASSQPLFDAFLDAARGGTGR